MHDLNAAERQLALNEVKLCGFLNWIKGVWGMIYNVKLIDI